MVGYSENEAFVIASFSRVFRIVSQVVLTNCNRHGLRSRVCLFELVRSEGDARTNKEILIIQNSFL